MLLRWALRIHDEDARLGSSCLRNRILDIRISVSSALRIVSDYNATVSHFYCTHRPLAALYCSCLFSAYLLAATELCDYASHQSQYHNHPSLNDIKNKLSIPEVSTSSSRLLNFLSNSQII